MIFEKKIKQTLENYEAPYNPADWADMGNRLDKAQAGKSSNIGKGLMIAASVIAVAGLIYYFSNANSESATAEITVADPQPVVNTQKNANHVQKIEETNSQSSTVNLRPAGKNKEKVLATNNSYGEKLSVTEKTETQVDNNINIKENTTPVQEYQAPTPSVLKASFHTDISKVCEGTSVRFAADNNDVSCTYKWYFGDGTSSAEQNPIHVFADEGAYSVKLRVTCIKDKKSAEQKNTVTVHAAPSVQISYFASDDNNLLINFDADAENVTEWKWDFGDKQTSFEQNPSHTYSKKGNYKAVVAVKNSSGCMASVIKDVNVKSEINLLAPTGFSPDGDGINDTWMPVALLSGEYIFTLTIYDKSGNVVFTTSDKNRSWDGNNVNTGDTFIWKAVVKDKNGDESNYNGPITIR